MERISLFCEVARSQGSIISLRELLPLLPERIAENDLAEVIGSVPYLSSRFEVRDGYVAEKLGMPEGDRAFLSGVDSRLVARSNLRYASQFISLLHSIPFSVVAVSGSTSYNSASRSKDLDLFCVAPVGRMWLSVVGSLLLDRVFSLFHRSSPQVCFSCVLSEDFAESAFSEAQGPLFARDALQTKVFRGSRKYASLIRQARWMSSYYPQAYVALSKSEAPIPVSRNKPTVFWRVVNRYLFLTAGRYVEFKAWLLNRKLLGFRKENDVFTIRHSEDHLIYESRRYADLRLRYSNAFDQSAMTDSAHYEEEIPMLTRRR
jgi:hypothetical protein